MELLFLFVPIIYVLFFILSCKENKYLKKHEEDEDNFCAPTDFNPANGAPMIGCLDIYGNPYGVSGAEDNHNDLSHNTTDDNSYNSLNDGTSYNSSFNNDFSNNSLYDDDYYKTSYDTDNNSY